MRRWPLLAALFVLAAGVLRSWNLDAVGISHWDAGSYTAGALGVGPYGKAPILPFYAPPLVPQLNAWAFALFGVQDTVAIALSALIGTLTVWAAYLFGRRLLGPGAALIAAAALAGMEYHIVYSRQPLTDGLYVLLFTLGLHALWNGWCTGRRRWFALAGVLLAANLCTKYHGFFPLLVFAGVLAARLIPGIARPPRDTSEIGTPAASTRPAWRGLFLAGVITAAAGGALLWDIQTRIGLDVFRANRSTWLPDLGLYLIPQTASYFATALSLWVAPLVLLAAAWGALQMVLRRTPGDLLVLGWAALFVATLPLYRNYPRLAVPLLVPLAWCAGAGLDDVARRLAGRRGAKHTPPSRASGVVIAFAVVLFTTGALESSGSLDVSDRGYADAARWLRDQGPGEQPDLLVTQHALLFYLVDAPNSFVCYDEAQAEDHLRNGDFRFLVADMRTLKAPAFRDAITDASGKLERVALMLNPLPLPFLVNVTDFAALDPVSGPTRGELGTIRIYKRIDD